MRLQVIRPRRLPVGSNVADLVRQQLGAAGFAGDVLSDLASYPAQQPTTYRRSGDLGRNWRIRGPSSRGRGVMVEVVNLIPYTVYVEGPLRGAKGQRQTAVMRRKSWPSVTTVGRERWKQHRAAIVRILNQKDQRVSFPRPR